MRLMNYDQHGELGIISFDGSAIPPYAILSHAYEMDARVSKQVGARRRMRLTKSAKTSSTATSVTSTTVVCTR
jgi:hypothetical protein